MTGTIDDGPVTQREIACLPHRIVAILGLMGDCEANCDREVVEALLQGGRACAAEGACAAAAHCEQSHAALQAVLDGGDLAAA